MTSRSLQNFQFFVIILILCSLSACSSKKRDLKTETSAIAGNALLLKPNGPASYYFSDLQILTETTPEGDCPEDQKLSENLTPDLKVNLNDKNELELSEGADFKYFAANVTLEVIGFDNAKYVFSVLDGVIPRAIPFQLKLRRIPGQILQIHFLDQVLDMKLLTTPVYTFSATEKRGTCTLKHNVNVFTERVGYFKKSKKD